MIYQYLGLFGTIYPKNNNFGLPSLMFAFEFLTLSFTSILYSTSEAALSFLSEIPRLS
jgi:hypothetical protein